MGTKQYDSATDLLTFSRASGGTALSKISYSNDELVTNGTFDSDLSGWVASHGASTQEFDNGTIKVQHTGYNGHSRQYLTDLVVGTSYQVNFRVTNDTQGGGGSSFVGIWETNSAGSHIVRFTYTRGVVGSYTFTFTATSTTSQIRLYKGGSTGVTNFDNISIKEVLFDQADGTLQVFNHGNNKPRIEYDATGAVKGLLIEEARTNVVTYSNDFTNSSWTKYRVSIASNVSGVTAPDGSETVDKMIPNSTSHEHRVWKGVSSTAVGETYSVYVKSAGYDYVWLGYYEGSVYGYAVVNLTNGVVTASNTANYSVEASTNGFYRISVTKTTSGTDFRYISISPSPTASPTLNSNNVPHFVGDGTSGIYVWGAQLEAGAFLTSYIPTTGAAATRASDLAEIPTSAFGYNNDQGSIAVEFKSHKASSLDYGAFVLSDGSNVNRIAHFALPTDHRSSSINSNNLEVNIGAGSRGAPSELVKFAIAFAENNFAASLNGATAVTDTSVTIPSGLSKLALGYFYPSYPHSNLINGHIKSIQYYPRRLTNAQLQELTT